MTDKQKKLDKKLKGTFDAKSAPEQKEQAPEIVSQDVMKYESPTTDGSIYSVYGASRTTAINPGKSGEEYFVDRWYDFKTGTVSTEIRLGNDARPSWIPGDAVKMPIAQADKAVQAEAAELKAKADALGPNIRSEGFSGKYFRRDISEVEQHGYDFGKGETNTNAPGPDGSTWVTGKALKDLSPAELKEVAEFEQQLAKYHDTAVVAGAPKPNELKAIKPAPNQAPRSPR